MEKVHLGKIVFDECEIDSFLCENDLERKIDDEISFSINNIDASNKKIHKYAFEGDAVDCAIAAATGTFVGILDSIFLRNIDLRNCQGLGEKALEPFVKRMGGSKDLQTAIKNLEGRTKTSFASDTNLSDFGGGLQHHLRDFAHHPTINGLFFSLLSQFTSKCYGTNTLGKFIIVDVADKTRIGSTFIHKLSNGFIDWFFHLASDMCGTSKTFGRGTGIPGPIISIAKELSAVLPTSKNGDKSISVLISKIFNGTLFADHDANGKIIPGTEMPLDFRTEIGMFTYQSIPVLLNMVIIRIFYFIKKLVSELKRKKANCNYEIEWKKTIPFNNRTIVRMTTIANGCFSSIDIASATIISLSKSNGNPYFFAGNMIMNINFAGLARLTFSLMEELIMEIKKNKLKKKINIEAIKFLNLTNAKIYCQQEEIRKEIEQTEQAMNKLKDVSIETKNKLSECIVKNYDNCIEIAHDVEDNKEMQEFLLEKLEF